MPAVHELGDLPRAQWPAISFGIPEHLNWLVAESFWNQHVWMYRLVGMNHQFIEMLLSSVSFQRINEHCT